MSQHTVVAKYEGKDVEVLAGWDQPLQRFFLVIEYVNDEDIPEDNPEGIVYSNLYDEALLKDVNAEKSFEYFKSKLMELGIVIPVSMIDEVEEDGRLNVGNKEVQH